MKLLIEIEISKDHPILHRKKVNGEAVIIDTIKKQLAVLEGLKVNVKKGKQ